MRRELLDFIDTYGHDFLNHLQVISGMAQLDRPERIRGYVLEITGRIREINRISKLENTTVAVLLLTLHRRAARYGVPVLCTVRSRFTACPVPAATLEAVLKPVFDDMAAAVLPALEGAGERLELKLAGAGNAYTIQITFSVRADELIDGLKKAVVGMDRTLRKIGGRGGLATADGDIRLTLELPRREA